jgi:hypothetical protein
MNSETLKTSTDWSSTAHPELAPCIQLHNLSLVIAAPAICGWMRPPAGSFFIQGADKSALVDPSDEGWIDDEIRIGLLCKRRRPA